MIEGKLSLYMLRISISCLILIGYEGQAQSVYAPAGSTFSNQDFSIDWTIGEQSISTYGVNQDVFLTQGFNQPIVICDPCIEGFGTDNDALKFSGITQPSRLITTFPNPTTDYLNIELNSELFDQSYLALYDSEGRILRLESLGSVTTSQKLKRIDVSDYLSGHYYIRIFNDRFSEAASFKKI